MPRGQYSPSGRIASFDTAAPFFCPRGFSYPNSLDGAMACLPAELVPTVELRALVQAVYRAPWNIVPGDLAMRQMRQY